jgi:acyl carrier protein
MKDEIIQKITLFLQTQVLNEPGRPIDPHEPLLSSGLIDSFSLVDVALFIEDSFHAKIKDTDLNPETFDNLEELAALIINRQ